MTLLTDARRVITGIIIGYLCLVAIVFVLQRRLQYFPAQDLRAPAAYDAGMFQEITLETSDGLSLKAWYVPAKEGHDTIVHYHGNGGHIAYRLGRVLPFVKSGFGVLMTEYRGYGGNPGTPSEEGLFNDGRAAINFLKNDGVKNENLIIVGESLGTGVAVQMAAETKIKALILESPFSSAVDVGQAAYVFLPVGLLMWDRFDNAKIIRDIDAPLLIIHGKRDRVVPYRFGLKLFQKASQPKQMFTLDAAGHGDITKYGSTELEFKFLEEISSN